jgi:hypothetical protein
LRAGLFPGEGILSFRSMETMRFFLFPVLYDLAETQSSLLKLQSACQHCRDWSHCWALVRTRELTRLSLGNQFSETHNRWKAARLATNRTAFVCPPFASGLRSEYSNRSWLTLAGSSCNWLQRRIRNSTTHSVQRSLVQEDEEWTGPGIRRNDWVTYCVHPWAHFAAHSIQSVTRFRLLFICCVLKWIHLKRWDEWSNCR